MLCLNCRLPLHFSNFRLPVLLWWISLLVRAWKGNLVFKNKMTHNLMAMVLNWLNKSFKTILIKKFSLRKSKAWFHIPWYMVCEKENVCESWTEPWKINCLYVSLQQQCIIAILLTPLGLVAPMLMHEWPFQLPSHNYDTDKPHKIYWMFSIKP